MRLDVSAALNSTSDFGDHLPHTPSYKRAGPPRSFEGTGVFQSRSSVRGSGFKRDVHVQYPIGVSLFLKSSSDWNSLGENYLLCYKITYTWHLSSPVSVDIYVYYHDHLRKRTSPR
jgi:hypothetical protein